MKGALERSERSFARAMVAFLTLATLFYPLLEDARAQAGCFIQTPIGNGSDEGAAVALQADGRIVVAGYAFNGTDTDFALIRYNTDLSLDTTFGGGTGYVLTPIGSADDGALDLAIQSDGKIVAAGSFDAGGGDEDIAVVRYNTDGSLDTFFGTSGIVMTSLGSGIDMARSVAIQPDGKIVVAGQTFNGTDNDFAVLRYDVIGNLDPTFDIDGIVTTGIGPAGDEGFAVVVQPDGKIVVAGESANGTEDTVVVRYDTLGALDPTFDFDGIAVAPVSVSDDYARDVVLQADGKIVTAGAAWNGTEFEFAAVRFDPSGALDSTFSGGWATVSVGPSHDTAYGVALTPDERIVLAGWAFNGSDYDLGLARLDPSGALDPSFDVDGVLTTPLLSGNDLGNGVVLQSDGRIVVAGSTHTGIDFDHVLVRYEADGSLACGALSLHPIADGSVNSFPNFVGCPNKWDCVNDQPANVGVGPVVTDDGLLSFLEDADGATNREMFALPDGTIPGGARVTKIEIHGQVGFGGGPNPGLRLSYQRVGWDGSPVDGPAVITGVACCTDAVTWAVTGLSWSAAELDALEIGVFHESGGQLQVSQLYVQVAYVETAGPKKIYRSIGTAPDYTTGTVAASNGLTTVTGSGTSFLSANRGRGDRIRIDLVDYIIDSVESETVLKLTEPFQGTTGIGKSYTISRQFSTLQGWEDCISGGGPCTYFPVASSSLVADDREEEGIAYNDSPFLLAAPFVIDGSTTDKDHTITLTAEPGNRHNGVANAGVVVDGNDLPNEILVQDDYVTIEWLEIHRIRQGANQASIHVEGPWGPVGVRLRRLLIHDFADPVGNMSGIRLSGGGGKDVKIRNTMIWNGDAYGIQGDDASDDVDIENVSIDNVLDAGAIGIDPLASNFTVQNTIVTRSGSLDFSGVFAPASSNNISQDGTAPGANALTASAASLFIVPGTDLHLSATAVAAIDTGLDLSGSFTRDIDGALRSAPWDRGADERTAILPFRVNYRSIGTNAATLASGTASVSAGSSTVTFAAPLTGNIGRGDRLNIGGESFFILSVDTATQVTVQDLATSNHAGDTYSISRAYNSLQAWENARDGDLVTGNRREVGVVYDDGPFSVGVDIDGSTTDATRYMMLTVAPTARHLGVPGGGALVDSLDSEAGEINVDDHYTVVEGLEVRRVRGTSGAGVRVHARGVFLSNLLIHECKDGVRMSGNGGYGFTLRNSIIYENDDDGVEGDEITDTMTIESCTVYGNGDNGIDDDTGTPAKVTNTISLSNVNGDFAIPGGTQSYNLSSDLTATGTGSFTSVSATDNPTPGPGNWVVFESLTAGSENLHLKASAANLAIDAGTDLSGSFTDDVDYLPRGAAWDIGADELGAFSFGATISSANNQSFVVGSSPAPALQITITEDVAGGSVTAANDIRIRIPAGFHMRWDTSITNVTLSGSAAARVDSSVKAYEDGAMTVVLDVTSDFFGNENLIVNGLGFLSFTAPSPLDNLELETGNDGLVSALDDKTIAVVPGANATISSDADQAFTDGAPPALSVPITVSDASTPVFAVGADIYIVIPPGLTMTWDTSVLNPTFGGPAASKVSSTVTYPDGATLVVTVTSPFASGDYLVLSDLYFSNFVGPSSGSLELQVSAVPTDTDDKVISIFVTKPVEVFTATSTDVQNHLEWVNPNDPSYVHTRILARDDGVFPSDPLDLVNARLVVDDVGVAGDKSWIHDTPLTNDVTYYYTAFVFDGTDYSAGIETTGRPFDHTAGDVQWAYSTGATAMAPPALRFETLTTTYVYMVSNDSILHSVGGSGTPWPGEWPANWKPYWLLGGPAQARPTVIPLPIGSATLGAVFLGSEDGTVHAVDADDGSQLWQSGSVGDMLLASPAGIFTDYGAPFDFLVIGSRNSGGNNVFSGLDPFDGSIDWTFDNSSGVGGDDTSMGIVSSGASVLYTDPGDGSRLFYFASRTDTSPNTVWCVKWDGSVVSLVWASDLLPEVSGSPNVDGSPIHFNIHGGRVYVGTNTGEVVALEADTGNVAWVFDTGDGAVKGFIFPRFGTTHLLFSTTNKVWSLSDDGASASVNTNWPTTVVANPSTPVIVPGSSNVLVGSSDGHLYQLDITDPSTYLREKLGDGSGGVGTPTVDIFNAIVYVGSEQGIYYAVAYPLTF